MADNVSGKDVTAVTSEGADSPMAPSIFRGGVTVRLNKSTLKKRYMYRFFKRVFDIVFSGVVCLVALVPGVVLCVAIRLDSPGSPFFRQSRVGKDGREIRIFKFRSMYADAHEHPEKYLDEDQLTHWLREQKVDDDPRITRIGHFLRSTSIDEVPQFLNVLLGDIPLRILKTRRGFSVKMLGAFALPARLARTRIAAFLQVRGAIYAIVGVPQNLFEYSIAGYGKMRGLFAKRDSRIEFPLLGRFMLVPCNGFPI